jgi:hypothetical protein
MQEIPPMFSKKLNHPHIYGWINNKVSHTRKDIGKELYFIDIQPTYNEERDPYIDDAPHQTMDEKPWEKTMILPQTMG